MQIALSKNSDVPLRQQLAEQIVFLITTGQLRAGENLPSVRALARQSKVHHNTVSEAYQELVRRGWLTRRRGTQLVVGTSSGAPLVETAYSRRIDQRDHPTRQGDGLHPAVAETKGTRAPDGTTA